MHERPYTLSDSFLLWREHEMVPTTKQEAILEAASDYVVSPSKPPLGLLALESIGAFFASFFLVGFIFLFFDLQSELSGFVWGATLIGIGWGIYALKLKGKRASSYFFYWQVSFYLILAGQLLVLMFASLLLGFVGSTSLVALLLLGITYRLYPLFVDRWLMSLFVFLAFYYDLGLLYKGFSLQLANHGMILLTLVVFWFSFTKQKIRAIGFAALIVLIAHLTFYRTSFFPYYDTSSVVLGLAFILILIDQLKPNDQLLRQPQGIGLIMGACLLTLFSSPGLLFIAIMLLVGFNAHEKLIILLAVLWTPVFIVLYYYNLELSLFFKSISLFLGGLVFMLGWAWMQYLQPTKEASS